MTATTPASLAVSLAVFGFFMGALDAVMNTHALAVERAYRRPILAAFHAMFSVGGPQERWPGSFPFARDGRRGS
ncbi:MFS transporter [Rarobacter incanus]|uniref:MFS transporter n=1 Tax=Rarobacter incanus TaxID=153494 RepID=UPI00114F454A|nr:MFS transporter [Rarobacter incanus]